MSGRESRSIFIQRLVGLSCLALPLLAIGLIVSVFVYAQRAADWSNRMYARQHVGELLIEYLQDHNNRWPESWEQLEDHFPDRTKGGYSFEEIQELICINFSASEDFICDHLDEIRSGNIKLVWSCSGDDSYYEGGEPNQIIADYIERVCSQKVSHDEP